MIHVYVTHHVTRVLKGVNDLLVDQLHRMREQLDARIYKLHVIYWTDEARYVEDIVRRAPPGVELVPNDRPGRPDSQPSKRNKVIEHARKSGCEAFVLLHNDVRLARGSLDRLVADWRAAESRWGRDTAIVSPRYIPYHLTTPRPEAVSTSAFWDELRRNPNIRSTNELAAWAAGSLPGPLRFEDGEVVYPEECVATDDGHILMMFVASPRFFDDVGCCDESFTGVNWDDDDWGMRALLCGKRSLVSGCALVGHVGYFSFGPLTQTAAWRAGATDNISLFVEKWGREVFEERVAGRLWARLHHEQDFPPEELGDPASIFALRSRHKMLGVACRAARAELNRLRNEVGDLRLRLSSIRSLSG